MEVDKPDRMELLSKLVALLEEHKKHKEYKEVKKRGRPPKQKEEVIEKPVRKTKKDSEIDEEESLISKLKDKLKGSKYLEPPKPTLDKKDKPKKSLEIDEESTEAEDVKMRISEEINAVKEQQAPPPPPPKIEEKQQEIQQTINQVVEAIAPDMSKIKVAGIKSFLGSYKNKGL